MNDRRFPALFISHGSPTMVLRDSPARRFMSGLGRALGRPAAIVCVSAHWGTERPCVSTAPQPETIHDFRGFPDELFQMTYPAPGAPGVAAGAAAALREAGIECGIDDARGLDHGAWTPLIRMYAEADVPVFQLSIQPRRDPAWHAALGRALAPLRGDGILVMGSGAATHNLYEVDYGSDHVPGWARAFDDWLADVVADGDLAALIDYRETAPGAVESHPTDEHLLPLMVAMGAGTEGPGRQLHRSMMDGGLSMAAYAFD